MKVNHAPTTPAGESSVVAVVSNRLPFSAERHHGELRLTRSPGGLVSALDPVLTRLGGVWAGWPGVPQEDIEAAGGLEVPQEQGIRYRPVPLSAREVTQYYVGFANGTLWPLLHSFVGRTRIDAATWRVYERVNERFAGAVAEEARRGALVWVHDYHLFLVPHALRRQVPEARLAFFLHVPFPAADVFRVLPWSRNLLRGMLASDLVGFQIPAYAEHFLACAERLLGCDVDRAAGIVRFEGREVSVQAHPISVDVVAIEQLAGVAGRRARDRRTAEILGVDRLDYTKGLHDRLLALERFLERYPQYHERVRFTQILVPSRDLVEWTAGHWRDPDSGIWEPRGERKHYVHSKVMAWVALERGARLAAELDAPDDAARWQREAAALRADILEHGWDAERQSFVQAYGEPQLDAAVLIVPMVRFLDRSDPRVRSTLAAVRKELGTVCEDLVYRYRTPDGLSGDEGALVVCSFWMIQNLAMVGEYAEAERLFRNLLHRANHLGLFAEEIDPATGMHLGNFPQGLSHAALINAAHVLERLRPSAG